jgi:hypothetical protein
MQQRHSKGRVTERYVLVPPLITSTLLHQDSKNLHPRISPTSAVWFLSCLNTDPKVGHTSCVYSLSHSFFCFVGGAYTQIRFPQILTATPPAWVITLVVWRATPAYLTPSDPSPSKALTRPRESLAGTQYHPSKDSGLGLHICSLVSKHFSLLLLVLPSLWPRPVLPWRTHGSHKRDNVHWTDQGGQPGRNRSMYLVELARLSWSC